MRYNNSMGALDMGLTFGPVPPEEVGASVKALYLAGCDPAGERGEAWRAALARAELVIVQELFPTATAERAHVVFPAMSFAEIDGTFTNGAGQVQRVRRARDVAGEWRPDWLIISQVVKAMGADLGDGGSSSALLREISRQVPGYEQVSFANLSKQGPVTVARPLQVEVDWPDLLNRLASQVEAVDPGEDRPTEPPRLGSGLFRLGTLTGHVPLFAAALGSGERGPHRE